MPAEFIGKVVSNRMRKSILVAVDSFHMNTKYKTRVKRTSKLMAHDENNECNIGDKVKIEQCRPLSKNKAFLLKEILHREQVYDAEAAVRETSIRSSAASLDVMSERGFAASAVPS